MDSIEEPSNQELGLFEYVDEDFSGVSAEFDYSYWSENGSDAEDPYFEKDSEVHKQKVIKKRRKNREDSPRPQPTEYIKSPSKKKVRAKLPFKEINQNDTLFNIAEIQEPHNIKSKSKKTKKKNTKDLATVIARQCKKIDKLNFNKVPDKQETLKTKLKKKSQNSDHKLITQYFDTLSEENTSTPFVSKHQQAQKHKLCSEEFDMFTPIKPQASSRVPLSSIKKAVPDCPTSIDRKTMNKSYDRLSVGSFKRKLLQNNEKDGGPEKKQKSSRTIQKEKIVDKWAAQVNADFSDIEMHELHIEPQKENVKHIF